MSDKIKNMINALINDNTAEAALDFRAYAANVLRTQLKIEESNDVEEVETVKGFKKGDRFAVTDVGAKPPQTYEGRIDSLYSDNTAKVTFDFTIAPDAENRLVTSGRMNLHHAVKV